MNRRLSYFWHLCGALLITLTAVSCFEIRPVEDHVREDDVPMIVDFSFPDDTPKTKAMVAGAENPITVMQLVCFDARGLYLGVRTVRTTPNDYNESVTSSGVDATTKTQNGRIIARVPGGTSRVHFIANRNLPTPLDFTAGTSERIVMNSLTTSYDDTGHQEIVYWGYHIEKTAADFLTWMQVAMVEDPVTHAISIAPGVNPNKVYLIRDRARLQITFLPGMVGAGTHYSKVEWLVHNGRAAGTIAPFNVSQSENLTATPPVNPWTSYTDAGGTMATVSLNECTSAGRYTLWESAADENRTFDSSDTYQYLFDDSNQMAGSVDGRVKIILKVYTDDTHFKYLVILLKKDNDQIEVVRNGTYVMEIRSLEARGYATLEDAINGTEFANSVVESPRELTAVSNENFILQVALDETPETAGNTTTTAVYGSSGQKVIPFKFRYASNNAVVDTVSSSSFEVKWEESTYGTWTPSNSEFSTNPANYLTYNSTTKCWELRVNLSQIGITTPYRDYIVIRHKASGITRYVHLYGIQNFSYGEAPQFSRVNGVTFSEQVTENGNTVTKTYDVYKLTFRIPDTYGEDLYPINIRVATSTLEPFSDDGYNARHGAFGVVIESTANLTGSNTATSWDYKAPTWGYWYEYSLPSMPHYGEADQGRVTMYFLDTRASKVQTNPTSVGLFLQIPYFGGLTSYYITP